MRQRTNECEVLTLYVVLPPTLPEQKTQTPAENLKAAKPHQTPFLASGLVSSKLTHIRHDSGQEGAPFG